jgi:hypothetical protein
MENNTEKKSYFTIFNNNIVYTFLYFILLILIIIIIFSTSYITISLIITLFFVYLFFSQLYNFFISKERNYFSIIFSSFIIGVLLIINFIMPNNSSILKSINNPNMNGTIIIIIYTTIIYSLLFIFSLAYSTYKENKNILYWISIGFIILYFIYFIYFSYVSTSSSILINILIYIPLYFSIFFILYYLLDTANIMKENNSFINNTSFKYLLDNPNYISPTEKKNDNINKILKFLLFCYLLIFSICFLLFLSSTSTVINKCKVSEYILYIINGLLILMLFSIVITMTNIGLGIITNPNLISQIITISFLIVYNIFISKNINDSCYSFIKNNASFIITVIYCITFYMYYKIIYNNCKIGDDFNLLIYFAILIILFVNVILNINNSKLALESYLNNINIYIYTIIAYAIVCMIGFIFIFFVKRFALDNIFQITKEEFLKKINYAFYLIFGIFILLSIVNWINELCKNIYLNHSLNATSIIINLCIIIVSMAILFKLISYTSFYQTSPLLQVVIGSIFYIPCLLITALDYTNGYYNKNKQFIQNNFELKNFQFNRTDIILFIFIIILYIIYFTYPLIYRKISSQNGKLLLKEPISLNNEKLLATHQYLSIKNNKTTYTDGNKEIHPYNYALSFWIFIDSNSFINSKNTYYSILNYGYNPNVQYRGNDNTLIVSLKNMNKQENGFLYTDTHELDNDYNIIIYKTNTLMLQKWNNIIINYDGSILDIFINGKLEKSFKEIIPYMKNDNITVGSQNGIHAGICNIIYFDSKLSLEKIGYIYNSVKMLNPPILLNYYDRLYTSSLQIENVTYDIGLKHVDKNKKLDYVK